MKEAFPFAHLLGMPQIKAHATEAARRVANSRIVTTARNAVTPKTAKTEMQSPTFAELLEQPTAVAKARELSAEEIEDIGIAERRRGAEIMAAAIVHGSPRLGLALLESDISAKRAVSAIVAARRDLPGPAAILSADPIHPRNYVSSSTGRPI
ncbi:hypothetical protein [Paraburkholderia sp. RL17-381-BIF-C]|uniref:hypothetical protein n=1 Tax=Paraburkholderia sp. RL17-381-BIF-C TaxID=3031635 RepID=UPI0038BB2424